MTKITKILHLEDSIRDSELIRSIIEEGEIRHKYFLAENEKDFIRILKTEKIDIILSDYLLPGYNGNQALKMAREQYPHMPFIFVSGAMGEDAAINSMLNGATDYVLKNKLERLVPAIKRALHEHYLEVKRELAVWQLIVANKELVFRNDQKEKRAAELIIANRELLFQNEEKEQRAAELIVINKELKDVKEKFRLVVESAPTAMVLINNEDQITLVNNQTEKLFGYHRNELMGNKIKILIPEHYLKKHTDRSTMFFTLQQKRSIIAIYDLLATRKNGTEMQIEIRLNPIETDEGPMVLVSMIDITAKKIQEANLIKQLELEIKNKELEQFAYVASHDLQEPLRTVSNYLQVFEEDYAGLLDENAHKYLQSINDATKRMSMLIKSLLDFSRLGQNSKIVNVDCKKLINDVIADLDHLIRTSNAGIKVSDMPVLNMYESEMREVFQNLITNAIKFRKKETSPKIQIRSEKVNDIWRFSVADNGIGIGPAHFEDVFVIFKRLHCQKEGYEGNGIGLANCKKIVLLHKGEIWIKSTLGQGTTFYFTIPDLPA
ncbi:MAG: ATP-binding protein [Bacteroidota bacterium]